MTTQPTTAVTSPLVDPANSPTTSFAGTMPIASISISTHTASTTTETTTSAPASSPTAASGDPFEDQPGSGAAGLYGGLAHSVAMMAVIYIGLGALGLVAHRR